VESVLLGPVAVGPQITKILLILNELYQALAILVFFSKGVKINLMNPLQSLNQLFLSNPAILPILGIWSVIWKGLALWYSARNGQKFWFIPLVVVNLFGLPEIAYLLFFQKEGKWIEKIGKKRQ